MNSLLPLFVILPFFGAFAIPLFGKDRDLPGKIISGSVCALSMLLAVSFMVFTDVSNPLIYKLGSWIAPAGINFVMDGFSRLMVVIINCIAFVLVVYSWDYIHKYTTPSRYFTLFLFMLSGLNGVVLTGDLFNLYLFSELTALSCYALVAFGCEHVELEAAMRYLILGSIGSLFILLGIAFTYSFASSFNMGDIAREFGMQRSNALLLFITLLFTVGYSIKCALMPFHAWLPDAHPSAPAPISAVLSSVVIKTLGIYVIARLFFNVIGTIYMLQEIFLFLGMVSMLAGSMLGFAQNDSKRMLAYSSISQIGYIISALALATPLGVLGALFHMVNHAGIKALLFLSAGSVEYATGSRQIRDMGGLKKNMPVTNLGSLVGSLSISGIPPFGGFWSKLVIILAMVQSGRFIYAGIAVIASVITLIYFINYHKCVFFGELVERCKSAKEVSFLMKSSMIVLAIACVLMGLLLLPQISSHVLMPAVESLMRSTGYSVKVLGG